MMNYMHILMRTTHCGIHLYVRNSDCFLDLSEHRILVKILNWMRASNSHMSEWKFLLSPCLCILGKSQLNYHFLCWLHTRYSKIKDSYSNDLPPLSEGFLNGPLLWVLWQMARTLDGTTTLSHYSNVYRWLWTTSDWGLAIVLPDKQMYQQC